MTRGRIDKRQRQADLLRKKRAQAASALTQGAKTPPKAILWHITRSSAWRSASGRFQGDKRHAVEVFG